jgi:hypothetical protein
MGGEGGGGVGGAGWRTLIFKGLFKKNKKLGNHPLAWGAALN